MSAMPAGHAAAAPAAGAVRALMRQLLRTGRDFRHYNIRECVRRGRR